MRPFRTWAPGVSLKVSLSLRGHGSFTFLGWYPAAAIQTCVARGELLTIAKWPVVSVVAPARVAPFQNWAPTIGWPVPASTTRPPAGLSVSKGNLTFPSTAAAQANVRSSGFKPSPTWRTLTRAGGDGDCGA